MSDNSNIPDLAHDISFAVFRVCRLMRHRKVRAELENAAVELAYRVDLESADALGRLVRLAEAVGEMNSTNAGVLRRELHNFRKLVFADIAGFPNEAGVGDISDIFKSESGNSFIRAQKEDFQKNALATRERQEAVLAFIRQFPDDCRMRDIVLRFPEVGERTLRNDIQKLIDDGPIERAGGRSGPASFLKAVNRSGVGAEENKEIYLPGVSATPPGERRER